MADETDPGDLFQLRYEDFLKLTLPERAVLLERMKTTAAAQRDADIAFIQANHGFVTEGPWQDVAPIEVGYVGVDDTGCRVPLPTVSDFWRFSPFVGTYQPEGSLEPLVIKRVPAELPLIVRVELGPTMPDMIVGRVFGRAPVQGYGVIDGKPYYFRSRGDHWSLEIGRTRQDPGQWYYEEPYGAWPDASGISEGEAYGFIAKAAALYRAGTPGMTTRTVDRSVQSIVDAVKYYDQDK